jgi:hypothetical protein
LLGSRDRWGEHDDHHEEENETDEKDSSPGRAERKETEEAVNEEEGEGDQDISREVRGRQPSMSLPLLTLNLFL